MLGAWIALAARRRGFDARRKKRIMGVVRVTAYAVVVSMGLAAWSYRSAKAEIGASSMVLGRDLAKVADLLKEPKRVVMNGEEVNAATAVVSQSPHDVLDRFEEHCRDAPGTLGDVWKQAATLDAATRGPSIDAGSSWIHPLSPGVIRQEKHGEGVVICLTKGAHTPATFADAIAAFRETHDLGSLGKLRYAYARPDGDKTLVLTVWTEDTFRLDRLFPASGDAPGADPDELARPPESTRLLSVAMAETPFGVFVYRSGATPDAVVKHYDARMIDKGWTVIAPPGERGPRDERRHGYMKDGVVFTMSTGRADDGATLVSIGEMAAEAR